MHKPVKTAAPAIHKPKKTPATPVPPKKVATGTVSFTAAQASAGEQQYEQTCSGCHGTNLEGGAGPALAGPNATTLITKLHATVSDIFGYMSMQMPLNNPASLTHEQYVNIMAFILKSNGYKPSSAPLTYSAAESSKASLRPSAP